MVEPFSNREQGSSILAKLTEVNDIYTNQYLAMASNGSSAFLAQKRTLEEKLARMAHQVSAKNEIIETYDREYLDRKTHETPFSFWRLRGLSTLQDWVLFIFFFIYALICLALLTVTLYTQNVVYNFIIMLIVSFSIGVILVGTIVRFA